jgi:hypothetical protein
VPSFATLIAESTPARAAVLQPLLRAVTGACVAYDSAAPNVHGLQAIKITKGQRDALVDSYDSRTVAIKKRLAKMIESLPAADADLCPYCSLDTNPDLDHFLPKACFPEYSLHARNLVPICTVCNRKKSNAFKAKGAEHRLFLHPSAEPSINSSILRADIAISGRLLRVKYRIDNSSVLPKAELALAERHYVRLGLSERYTRRAHSHLASFKASISGKPEEVVKKTLQRMINTAGIGEPANGWRPALYNAVGGSQSQMLVWLLHS